MSDKSKRQRAKRLESDKLQVNRERAKARAAKKKREWAAYIAELDCDDEPVPPREDVMGTEP